MCSGCGIGECVNTQELVAKSDPTRVGAEVVRTSPAFCLEDARLIREDIEGGSVDSVVIAACSPSCQYRSLRVQHGAIVERVNIREQVVWSHPPNEPETQEILRTTTCAWVSCGLQKADRSDTVHGSARENRTRGWRRSRPGSLPPLTQLETGFDVVLVEKSHEPGGLRCKATIGSFPKYPPYRDLKPVDIASIIRDSLRSLPNVRTILGRPKS